MKVFYQEESMCHHIHTHLTFSKGRVAQKSLKLSCLLSQNGGVLDCHSVGERKVKEEGGRSVYLIIVGRRFNLFKILIEIHLVTVL